MQKVNLKIFDSPEEAPNYDPPMNNAEITEFVVVANGTVEGNATVDVLFTDDGGNQFVAMITANILDMVLSGVKGQKMRLDDERKH